MNRNISYIIESSLLSIKLPMQIGGDVTTNTYDALFRLTTQSVVYGGTTFTKTMAYDSYNNLIKTTYPSGVAVNDTYDKNGNLTLTTYSNGSVTKTLFTGTAMNSKGLYTGYSYGNGKTSSVTFNLNQGVPTRYYTSGIQDLNYTFDANTNNLLTRHDAIKSLTETFKYDNLNRLILDSVNSSQHISMAYDASGGTSLGNIVSKSDVGNYVYNTNKINAVAYVTSTAGGQTAPGVLSQNTQTITYTPFLKADSISQNGYLLTYAYGQSENRIESVLKQGTTVETKYYLGAFERQVKGDTTRDIMYVSAGNGLCAIIVKQGTTVTPYFAYTDHLGSILTVTDSSGNVVAQQNFDPWGRNRNPNSWAYTSVPAVPSWLYRGFESQEAMPEFGLINFNGRIYDPALARMLGPDPNITYPWNTQAYNRYGFSLNNPLLYFDPTGLSIFSAIGHFLKKGWDKAWNDIKISVGVFAFNSHLSFWQNIGEIGSRLTKEAHQEILGELVAHVENDLGLVNKVSYFDGTVVLNTTYLVNNTITLDQYGNEIGSGHSGSAFTLGNFINGPSEMKASPNDPTFVHEYGRYLASQSEGDYYLGRTAIPNIVDNIFGNGNNDPTSHNANARAFIYFNKYYGPATYGTTLGNFSWDFTPGSGDPIPGYNRDLPFDDPANQKALKRNKDYDSPWFWLW